MRAYSDLLQAILEDGDEKSDRTGTGTKSIFGWQSRYDLRTGFPLLTTKKLHTRSIIHELIWFLRGDTNIAYLKENGVSIWDEWADENGDLGPVYGKQWRRWQTADGQQIDQIANVVENDQRSRSRRLLVTAWNRAKSKAWHCRLVTACFSFMSAAGGYRASSINAVLMFSLVCRSISHPTLY